MVLTTQQRYNLIYKKFEGRNQEGHPMCPLCGKYYRTSFVEQSLDAHLQNYHADVYEECIDVLNNFEAARYADFITCPICKKQFKSLSRHLQEFHNYECLETFRQQFPEVPTSIKVKKKTGDFTCELCGAEFTYGNAYAKHLKQKHNKANTSSDACIDKPFTCGICGKNYTSIKDHVVRKHKVSWLNYCKDFNFDNSIKSVFTEEHRQALSKNKYKFYNATARGKDLRKTQSQLWHTSNPACSESVKQKLSARQANKQLYSDGNFKMSSYGVKFKCAKIGLYKYCRSFEEFKVAYTLFINNIIYEYEPKTLTYDYGSASRSYIPDFKVGATWFEIKSTLTRYDHDKYNRIHNSLAKANMKLIVANYKSICEFFNIDAIPDKIIFAKIKELLDSNELDISYCLRHGAKSKILRSICVNYKHHDRIHLHKIDLKGDIIYEDKVRVGS